MPECAVCGSKRAVEGSMCPWTIACPLCKAKPGVRCKRPSGHEASHLHAERWEEAEAIDAANGITYP